MSRRGGARGGRRPSTRRPRHRAGVLRVPFPVQSGRSTRGGQGGGGGGKGGGGGVSGSYWAEHMAPRGSGYRVGPTTGLRKTLQARINTESTVAANTARCSIIGKWKMAAVVGPRWAGAGRAILRALPGARTHGYGNTIGLPPKTNAQSAPPDGKIDRPVERDDTARSARSCSLVVMGTEVYERFAKSARASRRGRNPEGGGDGQGLGVTSRALPAASRHEFALSGSRRSRHRPGRRRRRAQTSRRRWRALSGIPQLGRKRARHPRGRLME